MSILQKNFETLRVGESRAVLTMQIHRPGANNSINSLLLQEMLQVMRYVEDLPEIKIIILEGLPDYFCTGMDFRAVSEKVDSEVYDENPKEYYDVLEHLSFCSKIIISKVQGKVNAGGIGFVTASDIVIADRQATFGLSEALFGLLPACVMPFLIRRIGYQKALWLSLTTQGITAERAWQIGLVDELTQDVNDTTRRSLLRLSRLETSTIKDLKDYMSKLWLIDNSTRQLAVGKIGSLLNSDKVRNNIRNFIQKGKFPWEM